MEYKIYTKDEYLEFAYSVLEFREECTSYIDEEERALDLKGREKEFECWKDLATELILDMPEYIWYVPASSSGKYHPSSDLGEGGLIRHMMNVTKVADELLRTKGFSHICSYGHGNHGINVKMRNFIRIACLVHDGRKWGELSTPSQHTEFEHPLLEADAIMRCYWQHPKTQYDEYCEVELPLVKEGLIPPCCESSVERMKNTQLDKDYRIISELVASHMGEWTTSKYSEVVLPQPRGKAAEIVHYADYLASRTWFLNTEHIK